ncbi:MAG TPA: MarR family transcriptional regulator [Candidatus Limnocylindrales bacterium]|nr:MarR family transcriptional regulator [Candidatus Limnocylindrales bacterium]
MRTISPASPADRTANTEAIIAQLRSSLRELRCMSGDRMRRADMSFTHFHIVSMLERHGQMPMSKLADMLDVSLSNVSGIIDRMEEHGLVVRTRVPGDRRIVLVQATDAGRQILTEMEVLKDAMLRKVLSSLDDDQLRGVRTAFEDVRAAALAAFADDPEMSRHDLFHDHAHDHTHDALAPAPAPAA